MNQDLENIRENSGRARDSRVMEKVMEFNELWNDECYRDWFSSEVDE
jgi:hypothetical protein